jgi:hypothetical protein
MGFWLRFSPTNQSIDDGDMSCDVSCDGGVLWLIFFAMDGSDMAVIWWMDRLLGFKCWT